MICGTGEWSGNVDLVQVDRRLVQGMGFLMGWDGGYQVCLLFVGSRSHEIHTGFIEIICKSSTRVSMNHEDGRNAYLFLVDAGKSTFQELPICTMDVGERSPTKMCRSWNNWFFQVSQGIIFVLRSLREFVLGVQTGTLNQCQCVMPICLCWRLSRHFMSLAFPRDPVTVLIFSWLDLAFERSPAATVMTGKSSDWGDPVKVWGWKGSD